MKVVVVDESGGVRSNTQVLYTISSTSLCTFRTVACDADMTFRQADPKQYPQKVAENLADPF